MRTRNLHGSHLLLVYGFALLITARYVMAGKLLHGVLALTFTAALITVKQRRIRRWQLHEHLPTARARAHPDRDQSGDIEL